MSYSLYMYKEFPSISGNTIRLEIFERDFAGAAVEIEAMSKTPVFLTTDNMNNEVFLPIVKSYLSMTIIDTGQIDYDIFFTPDATKFKVILKVDGTTEWSGYLTPDSFSQPLEYRGVINLMARDNLGMLSEFPFDNFNDTASIQSTINAALTKIGFLCTVEYRTTKLDSEGANIITGLVSLKGFEKANYYEVLEKLLNGIGCQLRYVGGNKYAIFDISDLKGYGAALTEQNFIFIERSGIRELIPAWKEIKVSQTYNINTQIYDGILDADSYVYTTTRDVKTAYDFTPPYDVVPVRFYNLLGNRWGGTLSVANPLDFLGVSKDTILLPLQDFDFATLRPSIQYTRIIPPYDKGLTINFKVHNALVMPDFVAYGEGKMKLIDKSLSPTEYRQMVGIRFRYNVFLEVGATTYILKNNWEEYTGDLYYNQFLVERPFVEQGDDGDVYQVSDVPLSININTLKTGGSLSFHIYGYDIYYTPTAASFYDFLCAVKEITFDVDDIEVSGLESVAVVDANYNIGGSVNLEIGEVPSGTLNNLVNVGGIFKNTTLYPPMTGFNKSININEPGTVYHLSELIGREIVHHYKTQKTKLSGSVIIDETYSAFPHFGKVWTDGTLFYALNYGSLDFANEVMQVELVEVEAYETEDFTFVEATIDGGGGTSLGSGDTTFLQWSAAGNATRIYSLDTATEAEKAGAYVVIDKAGMASAKKVALSSKIDATQNVLLKEPTGFKDGAIVTYSATNRTITLTGTVEAYFNGLVVPALVSGWVSPAHPTTLDHIYFLHYDGTNFVWADNTFPGFFYLTIAVAYYRTANPFATRECHGFQQWQSHLADHYNIGTYRTGGGDITNLVLSSTTADNRRPIVSECAIQDEDLLTNNPALTTKKYSQRFLSSANTINYTLQANDIVPLLTNNPYYNSFTSPNFGQTLMPDNSAMTVWLFEVPVTSDAGSQEIRHAFIQGQSITLAANASPAALATAVSTEKLKSPLELNLGVSTVVASEYVCIHKFIITYSGGNWAITDSIKITGSRASQVGSPSGSYLTAVSTDDTITGNGSVGLPLSIATYAAKKAGDITLPFSTSKLTSVTLVVPPLAPTDLTTGQTALYATESGFVGEVPSGAGSVTSIALTVPTGLRVKKDAGGTFAQTATITESGEFIVEIASTYFLPTTTQWATKLDTSLKGSANGLAELDENGLVKNTQLPSYIDDVIEVDNFAALPATGEAGKIYVTKDDNKTWRWGGSVYVQMYAGIALGETSATAYRGDRGKIAYDHSQLTGNPHGATTTNISEGTNLYYTDARVATYGDNRYLRIAVASNSPTNADFAIGSASGRNFIQSHNSQPLDINPDGNAVTINGYIPYHSGNANLNSINWSAAKLISTTLVLPTSATLASGEVGLYTTESGFVGEVPSGAGSVTAITLNTAGTSGIQVSLDNTAFGTSKQITGEGGTFYIKFDTNLQLMTTAESTKLAGIAANANNYSLPTATDAILGGVKIGSNITITDGVISVATPYSLPTASDSILGGVKIGSNVTITEGVISVHNPVTLGENTNGLSLSTQVLSLAVATTSVAGAMSAADKTKLDGVAANANNYSLPLAADGTRGGIQLGYTAATVNIPLQLSSEKAFVALTKTAIEAALTGAITSHTHVYLPLSAGIDYPLTGTLYGSGSAFSRYAPSGHTSGNPVFVIKDVSGVLTISSEIIGDANAAGSAISFMVSSVAGGRYEAFRLDNTAVATFASSVAINGSLSGITTATMTENINTNLRVPHVAPTNAVANEYYFYIVE